MSERRRSPKVRKSERPEDGLKSEVGSPKSEVEENNSDPPAGGVNSEIKNKSDIKHPTSEIKSLPTADSKLLTEPMEVHHHPEVEKKGLKEYLLEGLMIFIAVMMGFFAESLRESIADSSKEKEYIISMIQDAKTDTAIIRQALKLNDKRLWALDSAANLCYSYNGSGSTDSAIYRQFRKCLVHPDFANLTERTLSQLKNAGGMRLIRKKTAVDSIISYEDFSKRLLVQQDAYNTYLSSMVELSIKLFNYKYFITYQKPGVPVKRPAYTSAKLINPDKAMILELANRTRLYAGVVDFYIFRLEEANAHAVNLIKTLRKAYNLEDE